MSLLRDRVILISLDKDVIGFDIYILKIQSSNQQLTSRNLRVSLKISWVHIYSIHINNGAWDIFTDKISCFSVSYNLEKKVAVSNNFVENFYSISPPSPNSCFIFSKVTCYGWYGNTKRVTERCLFWVTWQAEEKLHFKWIFPWYETRYCKAFISSKAAGAERNRSIGSRNIHVLRKYWFQ